ncbi:hypothetical protein HRJ34_17515 [Rhizorhabdus wittichii]|uniref:Uncharacterized protein n=1 Tax=Rhizorhabdus wittichii TaxID=160791 RepID=A0A975CZH6_9SPHN|nr:hypothetical protein [Rhizorhabdus wittichii]QTH20148.1 hypothetical protein HRJ34_17515 [Rhizorhabdus wittichii]
MMKLHGLMIVATAIALAGESRAAETAEPKTVSTPLPWQEATATVGSPIFVTSAYYPLQAIISLAPLRAGNDELPPEYPLTRISSSKGVKACLVYEGGFGRCVNDDDGDGKFDRLGSRKLDAPTAYVEREVPDPRHAISESQYIYSGATSDTLHITYRVITKGGRTQAFEEKLSVPLGKSFPQGVAIRHVKMTILSIDGMGMRYRIEQ